MSVWDYQAKANTQRRPGGEQQNSPLDGETLAYLTLIRQWLGNKRSSRGFGKAVTTARQTLTDRYLLNESYFFKYMLEQWYDLQSMQTAVMAGCDYQGPRKGV